MHCNTVELGKLATEMNTILNSMEENLKTIEESYKKIYFMNNWNSETRNYFYDEAKQVFNNIDAVSSKFLNVKQYLDTVIDNYAKLDNNLAAIFKF